MSAPLRLSWQQVYQQFGADPAKASDNNTVQNFRRKALRGTDLTGTFCTKWKEREST